MTRKHYVAVAKIVKDNTLIKSKVMLPTINKVAMVAELCTLFKDDNNLFDRQRFIDACDIVEN